MASLKTFYRGKEPNRPVAQFFDRMPWYFSVGFRWSVGRLKGRSDERRSVALPPLYLHGGLEIPFEEDKQGRETMSLENNKI